MTGTELTAKFYEACGREVRFGRSAGYWQWCSGGEKYNVWSPIPDLTQPGHLETVIGMVRERWPAKQFQYDDDGHAILFTMRGSGENAAQIRDVSAGKARGSHKGECSLSEALMLAAIQAAGLQPQEPADDQA